MMRALPRIGRRPVGRALSTARSDAQLEPKPADVEYSADFPQGRLPFTPTLALHRPEEAPRWPVLRLVSRSGDEMPGASLPALSEAEAREMYRTMLRLQELDTVFYNAQRQGRISFYMTSTGEEAIHVGSASALTMDDVIYAQYRETGVLLWRGFSLQRVADQCFGNADDIATKGRQMPIHYGAKDLNFHTISSPLSTQVPQAVGAAYALKLQRKKACAVCYFGEGAASEGDVHGGMNMAATLEAPVLFFVRNNGFAISTPARDQYRGDGIVSRASGYGIAGVRVDGNDLHAVRQATEEARRVAVEESRPVLIEAMSYRVGHHSTSDDSTRYRSVAEIHSWRDSDDPVARFRRWLEARGWWAEEDELAARGQERARVLAALEAAEKKGMPKLDTLFEDVYHDVPEHLRRQKEELLRHIAKYPDKYN